MDLHYYTASPNFGDDLNRWLWRELFGGKWPVHPKRTLVGIGSVINRHVPEGKEVVILGSGAGYGALPCAEVLERWLVLGVRGPLTARAMGLSSDKVITDAALLVRMLSCGTPCPERNRDAGVVFMPHHRSDDAGSWPEICKNAGVQYLSPYGDSRHTVEILRRASLVLAEAMHAAVVADALRIPWVPVVSSREISSFKWVDWTQSIGMPYRPVLIPPHNLRCLWREFIQNAPGLRRFIRPLESDAQFMHWRNNLSRGSKGLQSLRALISLKTCGNTGMTWLARWESLAYPLVRGERLLKDAAECLKKCSEMPGFLSDESVQQEKLRALSRAASKLAD